MHELLMREYINMEEQQGEQEHENPTAQFAVRNFFTGTGSTQLNRELANGHREFDGTTTMTYR